MFNGVFYGGGTKVYAMANMPKGSETRSIQTGTASQVKDVGGVPIQNKSVDPIHMLFDNRRAPTGSVVLL